MIMQKLMSKRTTHTDYQRQVLCIYRSFTITSEVTVTEYMLYLLIRRDLLHGNYTEHWFIFWQYSTYIFHGRACLKHIYIMKK